MSDDAPDAAAPAPASARKPLVLMAAAVVVGLAVGAAAGTFAVGPALASGIAPAAHAKVGAADDSTAADEEGGDEEPAKEKSGKEGEAAPQSVYVIDNLVLNPAGSGGTRFLLLTVAFEMSKPDLVEEMKTRDSEVRDAVLNALGSRTVDQLADVSLRESMKEDLRAALGPLFKKKKAVKRIYFPQFVIQ